MTATIIDAGQNILLLITALLLWQHWLAIRRLNRAIDVQGKMTAAGLDTIMDIIDADEHRQEADSVQQFFEQEPVPSGPAHKKEG